MTGLSRPAMYTNCNLEQSLCLTFLNCRIRVIITLLSNDCCEHCQSLNVSHFRYCMANNTWSIHTNYYFNSASYLSQSSESSFTTVSSCPSLHTALCILYIYIIYIYIKHTHTHTHIYIYILCVCMQYIYKLVKTISAS